MRTHRRTRRPVRRAFSLVELIVAVTIMAILAALVGRRIDVAQFREIPKDLEDAFLSVTRREAPAA